MLLAAAAVAAIDFPPLSGRVVDQAGLLDGPTRQALADKLAAHEKATSNQVVVAILKSLDGMDIADYGYQLGRHWGIGQKERNNGALLIVAPNERKVRIEVGYGLEGALTDALGRTIIEREILPRFKAGDYPGGIKAGVDAMLAAITGEYEAPAGAGSGGGSGGDHEGMFGFVFVLAAMVGGVFRALFANKLVGLGIIGVASALGVLLTGAVFLSVLFGILAVVFLFSSGRGGGGYYGGGSSRGGGFGGGGFSGGGGSFGGGGASGSW